ncbi:MAG: 1-deoxy-D-xylulose-5-phosphate synthase [Clostridia bacterium]|nr:1-deoxy-D-xylulose-5-phosphate synthase [Clostridia bacterium]
MDDATLKSLCEEIRDCIVSTVSKNGGHLASSLGAVELTVALHRSFFSPEDAILFDVGHQSYAHKLLTGRFDRFDTLRIQNGLSGYMRPSESEHDPFITGHSSNSISAAYGIYCAKRLKGENGTAIAVIGDGAMTGGMAYEALNNVGSGRNRFMVVLNDNKMSISRNVGALSRSLTKMRNRPHYHHFKFALSRFLLAIPLLGKYINRGLFAIKEAVKGSVYKNNIFSSLGFQYLGPVDGHNIRAMEALFQIAKTYDRPTLIHVITTKGKGYTFAENSPKNYHGVSPFDVEEGASSSGIPSFSDVAGQTLVELAGKDETVCAVTAAMTEGTGLGAFASQFRSRFFDVGIAEQHAVTFSAGLAAKGMKPFFAVYSSFLQRGFDQVLHDVAIGGYPVKLLIDRAGIVGEDGETHQGLFDVPFLASVPGMKIYSPCCFKELKAKIRLAAECNSPCAVRYPRGAEMYAPDEEFPGDFTYFSGKQETVIVTYGRIVLTALELHREQPQVDVISLNRIFPLSEEIVTALLPFKNIHFFEESIQSGGIAEHLAALLLKAGFTGRYHIHAIENRFVPTASVAQSLSEAGLDLVGMRKAVMS